MKINVLFICTHNSARSQMAEGLLNALFGDRFEAFSAGTEPTTVHPMAVRALSELGIDIARARSKSVEEFRERPLDFVVTVCDRAHQNCPFFAAGKRQLHKGFGDPAQKGLDDSSLLAIFRRTRDEIREWLERDFVPGARGDGGHGRAGPEAPAPTPGRMYFRFDREHS